MLKMLIILATFASFVVAVGLNASATLDLRRYMPAGLLKNNQFQYILHHLAFDARVPRKLQQRYLLSLFLVTICLGGVAALALLQPNYPAAIISGSFFLVTLVSNLSCLKRYMSVRDTTHNKRI